MILAHAITPGMIIDATGAVTASFGARRVGGVRLVQPIGDRWICVALVGGGLARFRRDQEVPVR